MTPGTTTGTVLYKLDRYNSGRHMVLEVEVKLKKWGSSIGLVLPKKAVEKEGLKEGDSVKVVVFREHHPFKGLFGVYKFSKSTEEILKEVDEEGWDE